MILTFFDIPVYRLSCAKYEAEREASIPKEVDDMEEAPEAWKRLRAHYREKYGGSWQFNEIIGFIRLHVLGTQIRGEWWRVTSKRVTRTRTKHFEFRDWKITDEEDIPQRSTNAEIYALIIKYLKRAQNEKHIKRFHLDTSIFERIGPHVDWNALLKKPNERPVQPQPQAAGLDKSRRFSKGAEAASPG